MYTGKEGEGQAVHKRARATPKPRSLVNTQDRGIPVSFHVEGRRFRDWLHAGREFTPKRGLTPRLSCQQQLPAAKRVSHCSSRVLHAFPKEAASALLLQKGTVLVEESHAEQDGLRSHPRDTGLKHILFSPLQAL